MDTRTYQGWTNWATYAIGLVWLNDEGLYDQMQNYALGIADRYEYDEAISMCAEQIEQESRWIADIPNPRPDNWIASEFASVLHDPNEQDNVNWIEIAEAVCGEGIREASGTPDPLAGVDDDWLLDNVVDPDDVTLYSDDWE